jgi:hypothetical protein
MGLNEITGLVAAAGATLAAIGAVVLLFFAARQAREMVEARYALARPLVYPTDAPPLQPGIGGDPNQERFNAHAQPDHPVFRNIGTGPALNVWCVMFGPRPTQPQQVLADRRTAIVDDPIPAGKECPADSAVGRTTLDGDTTLDGNPLHMLYAPAEPTPQEVMVHDVIRIVARYTITYHDIFGHRYAAIFDFTFLHNWHCVGFFRIKRDIQELNRERRAARMGAVMATPQQRPRLPERAWEWVRHPLKAWKGRDRS